MAKFLIIGAMMLNGYKAVYGIFFMMLNTLSLAFLDITAKTLKASLSSAHIVFLYKFSLLIIILPWILRNGLNALKTERIHVHICRSLLSVLGSICFVHGLHYVNMADAAALENIQYILLVLIGMVFFKEQCTRTKIAAVILGFLGAVIVVRPDLFHNGFDFHGDDITNGFNPYYGFILLAISFWTLNTVAVKLLGRTEKNKTQMFYLMLFASLWAFPFAFIQWDDMIVLGANIPLKPIGMISVYDIGLQWEHVKYLGFMSLCYFIHGTAYFNALKYEISLVVPFRYTKLVFSGILGYLLFDEVQDPISYIGYIFIVAAGLILLRYEIRKMGKSKKDLIKA